MNHLGVHGAPSILTLFLEGRPEGLRPRSHLPHSPRMESRRWLEGRPGFALWLLGNHSLWVL